MMSQPHRIEPAEIAKAAGSPKGATDPAVARTIAVLDLAFGPSVERTYDIRLWDGTLQQGGALPAAVWVRMELAE